MDHEIGRVIAHLKKTDRFKNTLILFLSDNGASAEIMVRDDGHDPAAPMGSAATYLCLGPGWSTTANTPFRKHKTWTHEGGIATPLIIHWPDGISAKKELRNTPAHVIDLVPTLLELAGIDKKGSRPGKSLLPVFQNDPETFHDALWWCHEGHRAILKEHFKAVSSEDEPWELYDLKNDRSETRDLAQRHPVLLAQLVQIWEERAGQYLADAKK